MADQVGIPIVPFGKYKGKLVTELLQDSKYLEWCQNQPGIVDKYSKIFNFIYAPTIRSDSDDCPTPEHNKLQNQFLKDDFQMCIFNLLIGNRIQYEFNAITHSIDFTENFELPTDYRLKYRPRISVKFEGKFNWDVVMAIDNGDGMKVSIKSNDIREQDSLLKKMHSNLKYLYLSSIKNESIKDYYINKRPQNLNIFIEIKPSLGDDYPCVLRKMANQIEHMRSRIKAECGHISGDFYSNIMFVLLLKDFKSESATIDELKTIFRQHRISIIFMDEVSNGDEKEFITIPKDEYLQLLSIAQGKY